MNTKNYFTNLKSLVFSKTTIFLCVALLAGSAINNVNAQQTYSFTNAGVNGVVGPTQAQVNTAYASTNLNGAVTVGTTGIQSWTVPTSGAYRIETYGAQGGGSTGGSNTGTVGGLGAVVMGDFTLTAGQIIKILVGQQGGTTPYAGGGGGGSFVVDNANNPMIIAGGGGAGTGYVGNSRGIYVGGCGLTGTSGGASNITTGSYGSAAPGTGGGAVAMGGTAGYGGGGAVSSGGGGFYNNGGAGSYASPGLGFLQGGNGGAGNTTSNYGGFGGGGGGQDATGYGGGAGGYSGGGAGNFSGTLQGNGGGGGSFNAGANQTSTACINAGHGKVIIIELCNISLIATGTNSNGAICSGNSVTLTTNAISNYSWSTGASTSSIVVSPTATTLYSLTATSPSACTTSAQLIITVNGAVPSLTVVNTATASSGICPSKTVALTASGAANYVWVGGSTTVTNGVVFSPTISSGYTVTGYNACGTSTAATSISIHPLPTVGAVATTPTLCSGLSTTLTATGNASTYTWTGGVSNGVGFAPTASNNYTVTGTSALGCTATAVAGVTVVATPSVSPTSNPPTICIGNSSTLTATGATNYTWLPGNASTNSIAVSPTAVINTYTVIRSNANCVTSQTLNVFVNQLPNIFGIATPTLVCAGKPSTLAVGGALTYTWTGQTPSYTFTGASPVVSPPSTNIYTVIGTDNNGCQNSATVMVATDPNPTISIAFSSTVLCKGQSVSMTASGGINYTWTSTSGTVTTATYSDTPLGPTLYNVTADNSFSCTSSVSQVVLVNPTPTINIAVTKTLVCTTSPSTLTATGANAYVWDANANNALTPGTVVNPIATTIYTVQGTYTATGCQSTKTVQVKVFTPTITVTSPTNTCYGGNITLVASGANPNTYNWNTGSGFVNPFQTIAVTPTIFTIYTVSAVSASNGVNCPSTQTTSIGIFYNPTITAVPQRTFVCRNESVDIYGNGGVSYSWSNAQTGGTITVSPQTNTTYTVTGTDANGCVSTGTILVKISGCVGINELNGSAKNGVSVYPNPNDGSFSVSSDESLKLNLVNELGQVIRSIELKASNSYKADVSDLAIGIYFIVGEKNGAQVNQKIIVTK